MLLTYEVASSYNCTAPTVVKIINDEYNKLDITAILVEDDSGKYVIHLDIPDHLDNSMILQFGGLIGHCESLILKSKTQPV